MRSHREKGSQGQRSGPVSRSQPQREPALATPGPQTCSLQTSRERIPGVSATRSARFITAAPAEKRARLAQSQVQDAFRRHTINSAAR